MLRVLSVGHRSIGKFQIPSRFIPSRGFKNIFHNPWLTQTRVITRKVENYPKLGDFTFHTTRPLHIPPGVAFLVRPLVNVGAFLFGRYFKRWWAKQTPRQKEIYKKWFASQRGVFLGILGAFFSGVGFYYVKHLETDPLTNRRRFILLNKQQQDELAKITYEMHLVEHGDNLIPTHHHAYRRVSAVVTKLLNANKNLPFVEEETWTLNVVNSDTRNAYVLPGGHMFVFLGTLNMVDNDDQLAIILAHEMAHVLLKHPIEQVSNRVILDLLLAVPLATLWSLFPDVLAFFAQGLAKSMLTIFLKLPYSRALETEADEVGLNLAAKACVDPREAVVFWAMMKSLDGMNVEQTTIPWLSTHPGNEEREKFLDSKVAQAMELRMKSGCVGVSRSDPRKRFRERSAKEQAAIFKARGFHLDFSSQKN